MKAAIILARADSRRLPGKALLDAGGKTLLEWCIERAKRVVGATVIVATSQREIDAPIVSLAKRNDVEWFTGDAHDVSGRVGSCITHFDIDTFARINGDSPFIDTELISGALTEVDPVDFVTNLCPRSYPYGVSLEVFKSDIYMNHIDNFNEYQREHITSYFYDNIQNFSYINKRSPLGDHHSLRLTVDTEEDFQKFSRVVDAYGERLVELTMGKVIEIYQDINACSAGQGM